MKEPGLDNRHRDKNPPKAGEIQQKAQRYTEQKSFQTNTRVLAKRDAGDHAERNREGERESRKRGGEEVARLGATAS